MTNNEVMKMVKNDKLVRIGELVRREIVKDIVAEKINEKVALRDREYKEIPWTIEELKALRGKALRVSALDSIERHAWKLDDVSKVTRIRTNEKHQFQEHLHIEFEDKTLIIIDSLENTYGLEVGDFDEI